LLVILKKYVTDVLNVVQSVETVVVLPHLAWHSILYYLHLDIFFIHYFGCAVGSGYMQSLFGAGIFIDFVSFPLQLQEELLPMSCVTHISLWIFLYVQLSTCLVITCLPLCVVQDMFCNQTVIYIDLAGPVNNPVRQEQVCLLE